MKSYNYNHRNSNSVKIHSYSQFMEIASSDTIQSITIESDYLDKLPEFHNFQELRELIFNVPVDLDYLTNTNISNNSLTSLHAIIKGSESPKYEFKLDLPNLRELRFTRRLLTKTPLDEFMKENQPILDLSLCTKLESLNLKHFSGWKHDSFILPASLRRMKIRYSNIKNTEFLKSLNNLEFLDLSHNLIVEFGQGLNNSKLIHLQLSFNPLEKINVDGLPKLTNLSIRSTAVAQDVKNKSIELHNIPYLITDDKDYDLDSIWFLSKNLSSNTNSFIYNYDRFIHNRTPFLQLSNLKERSMGAENRFNKYLQEGFQWQFYNISAFSKRFNSYDSSYKSYFIKRCMELYPQLLPTEAIYKQLNFESSIEENGIKHFKSVTENNKQFHNSIIQVTEEDILKISVNIKEGNGKIYFDNSLSDSHLQTRLIRAAIFNLCKIAARDDAIKFDYLIHVDSYFNRVITFDIALGIVIAMYSAISNRSNQLENAFMMRLTSRGTLKSLTPSKAILTYLDLIGIKKLFVSNSTAQIINHLLINGNFKEALNIDIEAVATISHAVALMYNIIK